MTGHIKSCAAGITYGRDIEIVEKPCKQTDRGSRAPRSPETEKDEGRHKREHDPFDAPSRMGAVLRF